MSIKSLESIDGLSTSELYAILTFLGLNAVKVFPEDALDASQLDRCGDTSLILNYQSSHEGGSHWYALVLRGSTAYIFDSLGAPPDDSVMEWADKNNITLVTSTAKAQSNSSSLCGLWAVWFIYMTRRHSPESLYKTIEKLHTYKDKTKLLSHSLYEC